MANSGNFDYREFANYVSQFQKLTRADIDLLCQKCARNLAARLLALVIPKTPVSDYPKSSGKMGGTLRRGWTSKTHQAAAQGVAAGDTEATAAAYAKQLQIIHQGDLYIIEVINPVEYSSYVEFGHRTVAGGWVEGKFMLTISEERLKRIAPSALEKLIQKEMLKAFNGKQ